MPELKLRAKQLAEELWHEAQPARMYTIIERYFMELLNETAEEIERKVAGDE